MVLSDSEENRRQTINGTLGVFFEAIEENSYEKYVSLVSVYWKNHLKSSFKSIMKSHIEDYVDDFNCYGGRNRLFFEITDIKVWEGYEFKNIKKDLENWYDATGIEAYVELDITVRDINGEEWYFKDFNLIKIDGMWYKAYGYIN